MEAAHAAAALQDRPPPPPPPTRISPPARHRRRRRRCCASASATSPRPAGGYWRRTSSGRPRSERRNRAGRCRCVGGLRVCGASSAAVQGPFSLRYESARVQIVAALMPRAMRLSLLCRPLSRRAARRTMAGGPGPRSTRCAPVRRPAVVDATVCATGGRQRCSPASSPPVATCNKAAPCLAASPRRPLLALPATPPPRPAPPPPRRACATWGWSSWGRS